MIDSVDEKYLSVYRKARQGNTNNNLLSKLVDYSFLKIYLHLNRKEEYKGLNINYFKRLLYTYKEIFLARQRLKKVLKTNSFDCIIIINESSHLKHAFPLKKYLQDYSPIIITNKKRYINEIIKGLETENVVYFPKALTKATKIDSKEVKAFFSELSLNKSDVDVITSMLNDNFHSYQLVKKFTQIIISKNKIKFIHLFNDFLFTGRVITDICNQNNILTYYLMHGLLVDEFIQHLHICNKYLVFGEYAKQILKDKENIKLEDVIIFGAPYLSVKSNNNIVRDAIDSLTTRDKKIVLILFSGAGHSVSLNHHKALIEILKALIKNKNKEFFYLVKLHSKDKKEYYSSLLTTPSLQQYFRVFEFDCFNNQDSIYDWIEIADVIITGGSFTAVEAIYKGKPVVTIDLQKEFENKTEFIKKNLTYHTQSEKELANTLDELKKNSFKLSKNKHEAIREYFASSTYSENFYKKTLPNHITEYTYV